MIRKDAFQLTKLVGLLLLTTWYFLVPEGQSSWVIWTCLLTFYGVVISAARPVELVPGIKSWLGIRQLFYLYLYLLLFFPYQLHVLGLSNLYENAFVRDSFAYKTNPSLILSTIGVVAFELGFGIVGRSGVGLANASHKNSYSAVPWLLAVLMPTLMLLFWRTGFGQVFAEAYAGSDTGDATTDGIYLLVTIASMWSVGCTVFFLAGKKKVHLALWVATTLSLIWAATLLVLGDRNSFVLIAVVALGGVATFVRRVPLWLVVSFLAAGLSLYNVVEVSRTSGDKSIAAISATLLEGRESHSLEEGSFGITTITSRAALDVVPGRFDYFCGKFKLIGLAGIVPYSRAAFVDDNDRFTTSSKLLTFWMLGAGATWGVGSNLISDAYLDFGVPGVIVLLFIVGVYCGFVQSRVRARLHSMKWVVVYLMTLALLAELPRYSVDFPVRPLVWTLILFGGAALLVQVRKQMSFGGR